MTQACKRQQRFRGVLISLLTVAALLARANGVAAQIYEWGDDGNSRHYANSLDLVPTAARATARLVVTDARPPADAEVSASNGDEDDRRQDQPPAEHPSASGSDLGFHAGWEAGYRVAVEEQPPYPAQPPIIVRSRTARPSSSTRRVMIRPACTTALPTKAR